MKTWNQAAAAAARKIFEFYYPMSPARDALDFLKIELEYVIDIAMCDDCRVPVVHWQKIGTAALVLGVAAGIFPENFENLEPEVAAVLVRKQLDYGPNNILRFGSTGLAVRVYDKISRLENLMTSGETPNNESLRDNCLDVIGYAAIGMMFEAGEFTLPIEKISPEVVVTAF